MNIEILQVSPSMIDVPSGAVAPIEFRRAEAIDWFIRSHAFHALFTPIELNINDARINDLREAIGWNEAPVFWFPSISVLCTVNYDGTRIAYTLNVPGIDDDDIVTGDVASQIAGVSREAIREWRESGRLKSAGQGGPGAAYNYRVGDVRNSVEKK